MKNITPVAMPPKVLVFTEPSRQHAGGDSSISEVAKHLEKKYSIISQFYNDTKKEIKSVIISELKTAWKNKSSQGYMYQVVSEKIKDRFRKYIKSGEHGIKTKAAEMRGSPSFIDTGDYYSNLNVRVER